jgi:hypothetical protein
MPRACPWLVRLPLIVEALGRSKVSHFLRGEVQELFGIGPSAAKDLMANAGGMTPGGPGTHAVISRENLLYYLCHSPVAQDAMAELARRKRLAETLKPADDELRLKAVRLACTRADEWADFQDIPGLTLRPGMLAIAFTDAQDLCAQLFRLSKAIGADWDRFVRLCEKPEEERKAS